MFEVHSDYGAAQFETEMDAISALILLASYHSIEIDKDQVREELDRTAYFERLPLAVIRS